MTDERTGRELTPRDPDRDEVVVRERQEPQTPERFYAGDSAHVVGLTEERAAQIVRQSGNARSIAFLATLIVALFIPIYWFYDLGFPSIAGTSRLEAEAKAQQVTDIGRGHELYLANCARCHSSDGKNDDGKGLIGPALNDQDKLYKAVTSDGKPGTGHLNANYLQKVMEVGGRYVCGDPKSVMPAWLQPAGPLNYREVEELIAFLTASKDITYVVTHDHAPEEGATIAPPETHQGWRDPNYSPAPNASPVPDCWRPYSNPAFPQASAAASLPPVENPGTADAPRLVKLNETLQVSIADEAGTKVAALAVKKGETVKFEVTNTSGALPHNFYIGTKAQLEANDRASAKGTPDFTEGTQTLTYTFDQDATDLQFACIFPGHYGSMNGNFQVQP